MPRKEYKIIASKKSHKAAIEIAAGIEPLIIWLKILGFSASAARKYNSVWDGPGFLKGQEWNCTFEQALEGLERLTHSKTIVCDESED